MRTLITLFFISIGISSFAQVSQIGLYIPTDVPVRSEMPNMSTNVGFGVSFGTSPFLGSPVFFELKSSWGGYSSQTLQQTYEFTDGTQTRTDVHYNSNLNKYLIGARVMMNRDFRPVRTYFTPQIGLATMKTKIVIDDPQDTDDCQPLDRSTRQRNTGFVYGGELGIELALDRVFKKIETAGAHKVFVSTSFLSGFKHFEYVNVAYMKDEVHDMNTHPESGDVTASFINVTTNNIHEHKIAELYHTPLRMWGINVGYTINF
jgi:hypothetical protein